MDISISIVRFNNSNKINIKNFCSPNLFDVLIYNDNSFISLPKHKLDTNDDTLGEALKFCKKLAGASIFRRAVPIPIQTDLHSADCPSTSSATTSSTVSVSYSTLFFIPVIDDDLKGINFPSKYQFLNLSNLVNDAFNVTGNMDTETVHFIERIEEWLSSSQKNSVEFLHRLFYMKRISQRIRSCVHNPAANPQFSDLCLLSKLLNEKHTNSMSRKQTCSDVEENVKKSHIVRIKMIQMEKYDFYIMNPVFNVPLNDNNSLDYYAKGKMGSGRHNKVADQKSPVELWSMYYPLHKAAMDGDFAKTQALLEQGYDPNLYDSYTWGPLHYCAFYGHLHVAELLMNSSTTNVNLINKFGDTPLHFACMNGYANLTQLILSSVNARRDIKNKDGSTALEVCKGSALIAFKNAINHNAGKNLEVHYGERDLLHMTADETTTVKELKKNVFIELKIGKECEKLFAIWIVGDRVEYQLGDDQKIQVQLTKYPEYLKKWGEKLSLGKPGITPDDTPKVVFKRKAVSYVEMEKELCPTNNEVLTLLFDEAVKNYLNGNLPLKTDDYELSAILFIMKFGDSHIEETMFSKIMPEHMMQKRKPKSILAKIEPYIKSVKHKVGKNRYKLQVSFLKICWESKSYGCTWFKATMHSRSPNRGTVNVHFGINDYGISVVNLNNHMLIFALRHRELVSEKIIATGDSIDISASNDIYEFTLSTNQAKPIENLLKKWQQERSRHYGKQEEYQKAAEKATLNGHNNINKNTTEKKFPNIFKRLFIK